VTLVWFAVWLVANLIGDEEPLVFDPVNGWAGALLLVVALDLARQHAPAIGDSARHPSPCGDRAWENGGNRADKEEA
jgi:hypothetical protein